VIKGERQRLASSAVFRPRGRAGTSIPTWCAEGCRLDLIPWLVSNLELVARTLLEEGAVGFRGFSGLSTSDFATVTTWLCGAPVEYKERTTPRHLIDAPAHVYTSTDYPSDQEIFLHNENAYASHWPAYLCFYCERPAEAGGETSLADLEEVESFLSPELTRQVRARGLVHRRTFIDGAGVSWQDAFGVTSLEDLQAHCHRAGFALIATGDRLQVEYPHAPFARHPRTGKAVWFNHAAFFQADKLDAQVLRALQQLLGDQELPNRIVYGDGAPLEQSVIAELTRAYRRALVPHAWQANDLIILDNMRIAHGRWPFAGQRRVWVSMANELERLDLLA
jgi:alpha-ketoglutarate-dependent taurine dioxygenase